MRTYAFTKQGDLTSFESIDLPEPPAEANQVVIKVETTAANRLDLAVLRGFSPDPKPDPPFIPGIDPAGTVLSLGANVVGLEPGMRVVAKPNIACLTCPNCLSGRPWACTRQRIVGVHIPGGFAPRIAIPAVNAIPIPDSVSSAEASAAIHSAPVALRMIKEAGGVTPGMHVVVIGGAGAVGSAAIQICRRLGAGVVAVVAGRKKSAFVASLGATPVDHTRGGDLVKALLEAGAGAGPDLVLDTAGSPDITAAALDALAWRGVYATCGAHGGGRIHLDLAHLYRMRQRIVGSSGSGFDDVDEVLTDMSHGVLKVQIDSTIDVSEAPRAYSILESRSNLGKIVLEHRGD